MKGHARFLSIGRGFGSTIIDTIPFEIDRLWSFVDIRKEFKEAPRLGPPHQDAALSCSCSQIVICNDLRFPPRRRFEYNTLVDMTRLSYISPSHSSRDLEVWTNQLPSCRIMPATAELSLTTSCSHAGLWVLRAADRDRLQCGPYSTQGSPYSGKRSWAGDL